MLDSQAMEFMNMSSGESILGIIHHVYGGAFLEPPEEYSVVLTENRVIFVRTPSKEKQRRALYDPDSNLISEELGTDAVSYRSLEWIIANIAAFYMGYEEIKELNIFKAKHIGKLSFNIVEDKYSFDLPVDQYPMAERFEKLWKAINELKECPQCGGRLAGPLKFCKNCDKKYNEEIMKLRKGFFTEPAVEISKGDKWTGLVLIFGGLFMVFMVVAVLGNALGGGGYILPYFCLPFPLFFVILGILIYKGKRSGKLIFGIVLLIFGAVVFIAFIMSIYNYDNDTYDPDEPSRYSYFGISIAFIVYGYHLARRNWKN